jgi:biopolymer transport protein ExbB/TolQ
MVCPVCVTTALVANAPALAATAAGLMAAKKLKVNYNDLRAKGAAKRAVKTLEPSKEALNKPPVK